MWKFKGYVVFVTVLVLGCEAPEETAQEEMAVSVLPRDVAIELDAIAMELFDRLRQRNPTPEEIDAVVRGETDGAELLGMTPEEYAAMSDRLVEVSKHVDPAMFAPLVIDSHEAAERLHSVIGGDQRKRWYRCQWGPYLACLGTAAVASAGNPVVYALGAAVCLCGFCDIGDGKQC